MKFHELQSPEDARAYVLYGLGKMRSVRLQPAVVRPVLEWIQQLASEGHPLPPTGFVADVGIIVAGMEHRLRSATGTESSWPNELARAYDDHVLSKLYADRSIDRAADALRRFGDSDRARAMAFIVESVRDRLGIGGATLGPASIKPLMEKSPEAVVTTVWQSEVSDDVREMVTSQYQELIAAIRLSADLLGPEDLFELERGTAVAELGQRLALRQVIRAVAIFEEGLPTAPPMRATRREAPTRMLDDDAYPVGGFAAISNRGSLESLLHSQLAYMETEPTAERPDLFDVKYLRDELLYYSRDENQFYRRRRHYVFDFAADLVAARTKDPELPYQRIVLTLAAVVAAIRRLTDWLTDEALTFELLFPPGGVLEAEKKLMATIFRESIAGGTVTIMESTQEVADSADRDRCGECRTLRLSMRLSIRENQWTLRPGLRPMLVPNDSVDDGDMEPMQRWTHLIGRLLTSWAE